MNCRNQPVVGLIAGIIAACIFLVIIIIMPIVFLRWQWARTEENKLRLTAKMNGLEESEVRTEVGVVYVYRWLGKKIILKSFIWNLIFYFIWNF